jgi:hypothetical protein
MRRPMKMARIVTVVWFLVALTLSRYGFFERFSSAALFGLGTLISATGFTVVFFGFESFRNYTRARGLKELTLLQLLRLYGTLALVKAYQGILPPIFALPTGIFDIAIALSSVYVARRMVSSKGFAQPGFYAWHLFGLFHLAVAASLAILTSPTDLGLLAGEITSQPITRFPMSIVPTFIGPLVLNGHLSALVAARNKSVIRE